MIDFKEGDAIVSDAGRNYIITYIDNMEIRVSQENNLDNYLSLTRTYITYNVNKGRFKYIKEFTKVVNTRLWKELE